MFRRTLEARNRQALDAKLAYTEFLALLVTWLLGSGFTSYSYGLNRFLSLLIARLYGHHIRAQLIAADPLSARPNAVMVTNHRLSSISSPDPKHVCSQHHLCFGHDHVATIASTTTPPVDNHSWPGPFQAIVIRHGVSPGLFFGKKAPITDQAVPYDIPR